MEEACGPEALRYKNRNKEWTADQRYELVAQVLAERSVKETAFSAGINSSLLYQWVQRYAMTVSLEMALFCAYAINALISRMYF